MTAEPSAQACPGAERAVLTAEPTARASDTASARPARAPQRDAQLAQPRILLLGAGGFLGLNVSRALLAAGHTPQCGRRARGNVLGLRELGVPLVVTDFDDPGALRAVMRDADVVVHAAAHYPRFSTNAEATLTRGRRELDAVLDAAAAGGVRRLIYLSSTATIAPRADGAPSSEADAFTSRPGFGTYHALKYELEARALAEDRFEVGVVNPAACLGPFDWKVGTSALLLAAARGLEPAHPDGHVSTVDARDVALAVARLVTTPRLPRRLILAAERWSAHALLEHVAARFGGPPPPPALAPHAARALADEQEARAERAGGRASLARELVDLIVHSPALDTSLARSLGLGFRALTDTLDAWETWARRMGLLPPTPTLTNKECT